MDEDWWDDTEMSVEEACCCVSRYLVFFPLKLVDEAIIDFFSNGRAAGLLLIKDCVWVATCTWFVLLKVDCV